MDRRSTCDLDSSDGGLSDLNCREEDAAILSLAGLGLRESDDGANLIIAVKRQGPFHYFARFRRSEISENPPGRFRRRKIRIAPWHYVSAIISRNTNDCAMIALPASSLIIDIRFAEGQREGETCVTHTSATCFVEYPAIVGSIITQ
jgi:hypothetical protein